MKWNFMLHNGVAVGTMLALSVISVCAATPSDISALRFYLTRQSTSLTAEADYNADAEIDAFDLAYYKRQRCKLQTNQILVSDTETLLTVLRNAVPGDEILLAPGTYTATSGQTKGSLFYSAASGTAEAPILLRSADPSQPAVLSGTDTAMQYVLYLTGDYWEISDLVCTTAQKGIVLDNVNDTHITGCEVYNTGSEGIALRDDTCNCIIADTAVHHTGRVTPGYGEGIYIGSWYGETAYGHACDENLVTGCTLGPEITAEHIIIKEMTQSNTVADCVMYGSGISGENYADSFIDAAGNGAIIRNNTCYTQENPLIADAFQVHYQVEGWGTENYFYDNLLYLDNAETYILDCDDACSAYVSNNTREPADGNQYRGNYTPYE